MSERDFLKFLCVISAVSFPSAVIASRNFKLPYYQFNGKLHLPKKLYLVIPLSSVPVKTSCNLFKHVIIHPSKQKQ